MTPARRRELNGLMVRFADGDRAAFRPLFDALWPVLLAVTSRALSERADAEDAAQRAMLVLFHRIVDLDRERDGVAWAATIAAYEVMTLRRSAQRRREATGNHEVHVQMIAAPTPGPYEQVMATELSAAVHAAVGELPARDQEVLTAMLSGATLDPGETPRKRRFRALERLRTVWRKRHG